MTQSIIGGILLAIIGLLLLVNTDLTDEHTCILKLKLTTGVLFSHGTRYDIDFDS